MLYATADGRYLCADSRRYRAVLPLMSPAGAIGR